ncbi:MAG: TonB-dependent receptor [Elusimicrobiota bacterium]
MFKRKKDVLLVIFLFFVWGGRTFLYSKDEPLIVVSATLAPLSYPNAPTNVNVISREEIEQTNAQNVGEAINYLPGIEVSRHGSLGALSQVRLRGFFADQVLVLIDNRPVGGISLGVVDLSLIPLDNVERIEVVRGPGSSVYGANALGGVVNIITKTPKNEIPYTEYTVQQGSFSTYLNRLSFDVRKEKLGILLSASENNSQGFRDNGGFQSANYFGSFEYRLNENNQLLFSGGYAKKRTDVPGPNPLRLNEFDGHKERSASTPNTFQKDKDVYGQLVYKLLVGEKNMFQGRVYSNVKENFYNQPDDWAIKNLADEKSNGAELQWDTVYGFVLGTNLHTDYYVLTDQLADSEQINKKAGNFAFFLEDNLHLKKLTVVPGVRYDRHKTFGAEVNPRLSAIYQANEQIKFSTNFGRAYRVPTFNDLYYPSGGNPDLKPEISLGGDCGTEYKIRGSLTARLTYFHSRVKEMIRWSEDANTGVWHPVNNKVINQGLELELENNFFSNLSGKLGYSFLHNRKYDFKASRYVEWFYTPAHRLTYQIGYQPSAAWNINTGLEYVDKQYASDDKTGTKLPSYTLWGLRVSRKIISWDFFAGVDNLTNKRYIIRQGYPLPGRTYYAGATARFSN